MQFRIDWGSPGVFRGFYHHAKDYLPCPAKRKSGGGGEDVHCSCSPNSAAHLSGGVGQVRQERWIENIRLSPETERRAIKVLTRELQPFRNLTFQVWNEHNNERVIPLVKLIKALDPKRLVTNSPRYAPTLVCLR
jgi:hypothetical protein